MQFIKRNMAVAIATLAIAATSAQASSQYTASVGSNTSTYSQLQSASGWQACSSCANGGGVARYTMRQQVNSPSLTGNATAYTITSGTRPFSDALWHHFMGRADTRKTHFQLDLYVYMTNPSASGGLEIESNQAFGGKWYKYSHQCSYTTRVWKTWNPGAGKWVNSGIACTPPKPYTWQHLTLEFARSNGKVVPVSIAIDGATHYLSGAFSPQGGYGSNGESVRFQINGNSRETPYTVWVDKMTYKEW